MRRSTIFHVAVTFVLIVTAYALDRSLGQPLIARIVMLGILVNAGVKVWGSRRSELTDFRYRLALGIALAAFAGAILFGLSEIFDAASAILG
ncbi:MAG TPA: hypothetical protein PKG84_07060 [Novosphingobium sp.]|nr:hypothetical protein [Novosphingobium sp.]